MNDAACNRRVRAAIAALPEEFSLDDIAAELALSHLREGERLSRRSISAVLRRLVQMRELDRLTIARRREENQRFRRTSRFDGADAARRLEAERAAAVGLDAVLCRWGASRREERQRAA
jgi:hypothetical protein